MMEAKLRQMESTNPKPLKPEADSHMEDVGIPSTPSSLPYHPSLPMKPPPALPEHVNIARPSNSKTVFVPKPKTALPALPLTSGSHSLPGRGVELKPSVTPPLIKPNFTSSLSAIRPTKSAKLIGVKIKPKEKDSEAKKE